MAKAKKKAVKPAKAKSRKPAPAKAAAATPAAPKAPAVPALKKGQRITYTKPAGSVHGGSIKAISADGLAHIAIDDGTEVKDAPRGKAESLKPGEWCPV